MPLPTDATFEELLKALAKAAGPSAAPLVDGIRELRKADSALMEAMRDTLKAHLGPSQTPPEHAEKRYLKVARPGFFGAFWRDGDWYCIRLEERTVGFGRPEAYYDKIRHRPSLRNDRDTAKWMDWMSKVALAFHLEPLEGHVRAIVCPGLAWHFYAWRKVEDRPIDRIHPADCDNAAKPTMDGFQKIRMQNRVRLTENPAGGYWSDNQVVDLYVRRLPQDGKAPIDRAQRKRLVTQKRRARAKNTTDEENRHGD